MVRYALSDTRARLTDDQFDDVLRAVMTEVAGDPEFLAELASEPQFAADDLDLAMDVNFRAIREIGSARDCRFFSAIAAMQAMAFRHAARIAPEVIPPEVAECAWAWNERWRHDLSGQADALGRKFH